MCSVRTLQNWPSLLFACGLFFTHTVLPTTHPRIYLPPVQVDPRVAAKHREAHSHKTGETLPVFDVKRHRCKLNPLLCDVAIAHSNWRCTTCSSDAVPADDPAK